MMSLLMLASLTLNAVVLAKFFHGRYKKRYYVSKVVKNLVTSILEDTGWTHRAGSNKTAEIYYNKNSNLHFTLENAVDGRPGMFAPIKHHFSHAEKALVEKAVEDWQTRLLEAKRLDGLTKVLEEDKKVMATWK